MDNELTAAEIEEAIIAARIFSSDYGQEQFQALRELERRLADSGYLGAVQALSRLEKERGVACIGAMDIYVQLLKENEELEQKAADSRATLEMVDGEVRQTQDKLHQLEEAIKQAKAEREREEREQRRIDEELEQCRQEANVSKEETVVAGQIKAEVEKHGFSLDLALGLSQEFAGYENIRDEVAKALKRGQTLTKYNEQVEERNEALQTAIEGLEGNRHHLEGVLSQQRAEIAENRKMIDFCHRYLHLQALIDYLGSWSQVTFHHCTWCGALFWVLFPGNVSATVRRCPGCGTAFVEPDRNAYAAIKQKPGVVLQLLPGE